MSPPRSPRPGLRVPPHPGVGEQWTPRAFPSRNRSHGGPVVPGGRRWRAAKVAEASAPSPRGVFTNHRVPAIVQESVVFGEPLQLPRCLSRRGQRSVACPLAALSPGRAAWQGQRPRPRAASVGTGTGLPAPVLPLWAGEGAERRGLGRAPSHAPPAQQHAPTL